MPEQRGLVVESSSESLDGFLGCGSDVSKGEHGSVTGEERDGWVEEGGSERSDGGGRRALSRRVGERRGVGVVSWRWVDGGEAAGKREDKDKEGDIRILSEQENREPKREEARRSFGRKEGREGRESREDVG